MMLSFCFLITSMKMDRSGRFDFWGMLLRTHAITPPPAMPNLWLHMVKLLFPGWLVLTVVAATGVGAVLYVRILPAVAVNQPAMVAAPSPARQSPPW